jgi:FAD/FMN-containing dehydrogenase
MKITKNKEVYEQDITGTGKAHSIVFPESLEELQNIIRSTNIDIVPRGAGINFSGSTLPQNSIIIDMAKLNNIIDLDINRKTIIVEPGVTVDQLNNHLSQYGLEFPINPLFSELRTLGGLVATNASGNREIKYGKLKNWIESLEAINGKAELLTLQKSDIGDFTGMEGTTGVITKIKLKLTTKKQRSLSVFKTNHLGEALNLSRKLKLDQEVTMISCFDPTLSLLSGLEKKYHIFVEYESNAGTFKQQFYEKFIQIKNRAYYVLANNGYTILENPKFFLDSLQEFLLYLEENKLPYFTDLGSGAVYLAIKPQEIEKHNEILKKIKRLRGIMSYNFGIGLNKKQFLDRNEKTLIARIKLRQDPKLKFNINKLIDQEIIQEIINEKSKESLQLTKDQTTKTSHSEENLQDNKIDSLTGSEEEPKVELLDELKTPEEKLEEFIEEEELKQDFEEVLEAKPIDSSTKILKTQPSEKREYIQLSANNGYKDSTKDNSIDKEQEQDQDNEDPKKQELDKLHNLIKENKTIEKKPLTKEEQDHIKKIAGGFFG